MHVGVALFCVGVSQVVSFSLKSPMAKTTQGRMIDTNKTPALNEQEVFNLQ